MAQCGYCGTTILFGGLSDGGQRFCNRKCHQNAYVLRISQQVPANVVERQAEEVFRGNCPKCRGLGPIDVHKVHRVWSALLLTSWSSSQQVSCRACGVKSQIGGILFSGLLGWWGLPWGLIMTPVQIARNISGMCAGNSSGPSPELRRLVQVMIGMKMLQAAQSQQSASGPPPVLR